MRRFNAIPVRGPWPWSDVRIEGGPYRKAPAGAFGVCMAQEIDLGTPPNIGVPVKDFSVPEPEVLVEAAMRALAEALNGRRVFVGCGFGLGRTGTMLATMVRIAWPRVEDPVAFVREAYDDRAVETGEQRALVEGLDLRAEQRRYRRWLWRRRVGLKIHPR